MQSQRSSAEFNAYRCGNCGQNDRLRLCSGCRLISFCSSNCQQSYWQKHRPLCLLISKLIRAENKNTIFEVRKEMMGDVGGAEGLMRAIVLLNEMLHQLLGRELSNEEHLLLSYPKYCEVCYETDPYKLIRCPDCKFSSFCKDGECQATSAADPNIHKKYCEQKKIAFLCKSQIKYEKVFESLPEPTSFKEFLFENPSRDLFTLIEHLTDKKFTKNPSNPEEMIPFVTICQFTFTATILLALQKVKLLQPDRESLCIDIVGANYEETYFNDDTCSLFFAFMPKLHSLKINLIGPEVTSSRTEDLNCFGKTVKMSCHKVPYEYYTGPPPDFIICFNCGFSEEPYEDNEETSWVRGVSAIIKKEVPFAFTTYTASELTDEIQFVHRAAEKLNVKDNLAEIYKGANDFNDLRPYQNFDKASDERLYYANRKLCVMSWKD
ncbi:uncharacterized protein LOC134832361 [Culicoides brevitarsis]|uniref:uncharacterized protein LOC134832361 n=1 Tax=Culicoides brevitarsis TaxID=469753 RepID=UPI00307B9E83